MQSRHIRTTSAHPRRRESIRELGLTHSHPHPHPPHQRARRCVESLVLFVGSGYRCPPLSIGWCADVCLPSWRHDGDVGSPRANDVVCGQNKKKLRARVEGSRWRMAPLQLRLEPTEM
eukprot:scaffold19988_cov126-Isochrysis_galbana.AAC.5